MVATAADAGHSVPSYSFAAVCDSAIPLVTFQVCSTILLSNAATSVLIPELIIRTCFCNVIFRYRLELGYA